MYDNRHGYDDMLDLHRMRANEEESAESGKKSAATSSANPQSSLRETIQNVVKGASAVTGKLESKILHDGDTTPHLADLVDTASISNADIEATWEYQQYMNAGKKWQKEMKLTPEEATLACLLMLQAMKDKQEIVFKKKAEEFALAARARLKAPDPNAPVVYERLATEISVLTEERANEVFTELSKLQFPNPYGNMQDIPFQYTTDGCYARAFFMEQRLTALGIASQKVFVVAEFGHDLKVNDDYATGFFQSPPQQAQTKWSYHVAPIIKVLKEGKEVDMVFDPSLFTEPVTVAEWLGKMGSDSEIKSMTLDEVKKLKQDKGSSDVQFAIDNTVSYVTDRDNYTYDELLDQPKDKKDKEKDLLDSRVMLTVYGKYVPIREIAAKMRKQLKAPETINAQEILTDIQHLDSGQRLDLSAEYRSLIEEWEKHIPGDDSNKINDELKK